MASNKTFRFGPVALTTTLTTNLLNPPAASGGVNAGSSSQYVVLKHLRITNKTGQRGDVLAVAGGDGCQYSGYRSDRAAQTVPANSSYDWYGLLRIDAADFLVGGASANTALTISGEGEIGVAG
jgi:hypothetical protein